MLDKEDVATAKEIAKVLRESKVDELVVAGNLITVLLAEREQQRTAAEGEDTRRAWIGLNDEDWDYINKYCGSTRSAIKTVETLLRKKNT